MHYWILIALLVGLGGLAAFLLLRRKRHSHAPGKINSVDFDSYKSGEIFKRGHYHDIVKKY